MNWFFGRELDRLGRQADPDRRFVRSLEKRLKQEVGHPVWWVQWSKIASGVSLSLVLASGATGVYAYTSDDVTPNHPLYALRTTIEDVEQQTATTPQAKVVVTQKVAQRRLKAKQKLEETQKQKALKQAQDKKVKEDLKEVTKGQRNGNENVKQNTR